MLPYFLLVLLPLLAWAISPCYRFTVGRKTLLETNKLPIDIFMLMVLLLLALRGLECGNDTNQYFTLFQRYGSLSIERLFEVYDHELGFKIFNKLVYSTVNNYQVFLALTAVICVLPLWYFYRRESELQPLTMALFLTVAPFVMYFSGIRQAMAMSMGFFAWYAARDRKFIRFLLVIVLAMQWHNSAFVLLAIYPLYRARITKKWLWFVVPSIIFVYVFRVPIFNSLITLLWEEYDSTASTGAVMILLLLILFAAYSYIMTDDKELDQETIGMRNILLLAVVLQIFAILHPLSMRMNYYFLLFVPILIPRIVSRTKPGFAQVARLSAVVMTVFFFLYFLTNGMKDNDDLNIFPYIPFWKG